MRSASFERWISSVQAMLLMSSTIMVTSGTLWMASTSDALARFYRWSDETGATHYTDHLPPDQASQGHIKLDQFGIEIEAQPGSASGADRQAALSDEEFRLIDDAKLLKAARSYEELLLLRDGKLAELDGLIQVSRETIRRQRLHWGELPPDGATFAAGASSLADAGPADPASSASFGSAVAASEPRILDVYWDMIGYERRRAAFLSEFTSVSQRFRRGRLPEPSDSLEATSAHYSSLVLLGCGVEADCDALEERANRYLSVHLTVPERISGDRLEVFAQVDPEERRHFTLARLETQGGNGYLVLDLQCKNRMTGDATCRNAQALQVVAGFREEMSRAPDRSGQDAGSLP